ncbi:protein translocase subunit SecD [Candidatus Peregrinibacteria bacterium]|nr:protein translocase subunit SecD [Candidatus Peregrinibacteria bacterium]
MSQKRSLLWPALTAVVGVFALLIALPDSAKEWAPGFLRSPTLHYGLDLIGGTQLDFRISEEEIEAQLEDVNRRIATLESSGGVGAERDALLAERASIEEQRTNLTEAIRTVLERRINALGVSEAVITPSFIAGEKHLLVECPGVVDTQECINTVGKTIQLEFKEEHTEASDEYKTQVRARVARAKKRMTASGHSLQVLGQDLGDELGTAYIESRTFFRDQLPKGLESMWDARPGQPVAEREGVITQPVQNDDGTATTQEIPGIWMAQAVTPRFQTGRVINEAPKAFDLLSKTEQNVQYAFHDDRVLDSGMELNIAGVLRTMESGTFKTVTMPDGSARLLFMRLFEKGGEQMTASHILVAYEGASEAAASITRTKEQALERAKALKARADQGADFHTLAQAESDGPSRANGGRLGTFSRGTLGVPALEAAAFALQPRQVSEPVETSFGYHIILAEGAKKIAPDTASYDELTITGPDAETRANVLLSRLQAGDVQAQEDAITLRALFFSLLPTGWKDTTLDGKHFRAATVTLDPVTNIPVVQILFDAEGGKIFQELTKKNVNKRIAIFVGGELVSAPVVQQEIIGGTAVITGSQNFEEAKSLAQDLNTGAIPAPIHLVGQHTVEATLGDAALRTSLLAALIGIIILMIYMIVVYRLLGIIANIALLIYAILFLVILKFPLFLFSGNYIVLTLAGMAGIILSLGMAVDANVLVFERMKEELRKGKMVKTAVETSFQHAWPAIRDGNVSTLITCVILFMVGTSIVRGFAITLGLGVVLSMFTAITVTRWILRRVAETKLAERPRNFGVKPAAQV